MGTVPTNKGDTESTSSASLVVFATIADTTWRMFVPVFAGALIGYGLDRLLGSRPTGVISGTFLGVGLAIVLVYLQYKSATAKPPTNPHKGDS